MMVKFLPLFQYPTTIVWVDDDKLFLQTAKLTFKDNNTQRMFSSPTDCTDFFKTYQSPLSHIAFLQGEHNDESYGLLEHAPVDFDVTSIVKLRDYPERLTEISLLICDYNMPKMNGLELCGQLRKFPFKKILLTGEAENKDAVRAFNDGMIDRFIRKDSLDLPEELQSYTKTLIRQYFCEQTNVLLSHLEVDYSLPLSDPVFVSFFDAWCEKNKIVEFYLIDKQGSFLVVNEQKETRYFVVHTDRSLDRGVQLYSDNPQGTSFIQSVKNRSKIPFFGYGKEAWQVDYINWGSYFYTPKVFDGRERYYWAVV